MPLASPPASRHAFVEVVAVHIAEREQFARHGQMGGADAAAADDAAGEDFRWRGLAVEAQHAAWNDLHGRHGGECS